ncbi:MAG: M28 family peptidase [Novosphingobium sp.]|nr:M28 family peptidase [Novosphingobium sp.]
MKLLLPLALGVLLAGCAGPAAREAPASAAQAVPPVPVEGMKQMVRVLSADEMEGRAPGTATEPKVLDAIVARFKAAGLEPGNNGSWLQPVPTVEVTAGNFSALTVSGKSAALSFPYGEDYVAASYRVVPHTRIADSELVFVGYGIVAPELGWNDYAGIDMKGKTAVILVNDPDYALEGEDGLFKGRRMTYYGRWTYKFEEAARQGAAAALIVHDTFPAAYGWNVVHSSWSGAQYYVQSADDGADQTAANGWIQTPVAETILKAAGQDPAAVIAAAGRKGFRPVPLGLTVGFSFDNTIRRATSHNVIGVRPGTARKDEVVLHTAHWDHLGRCAPDATGDDICNGAVDNATGVAALVALAEMNRVAGPTPRSQVYLAVTLEESGLLGSEWYARHPVWPLAKTAGVVNMDALHPTGRARDYAMNGGDKSDLTAIFRRAVADMGLRESPEPGPERGMYYRSDHFSFARRGVPGFHIARGRDLFEGGTAAGDAAAKDYTDNRYHAPGDEYDESWDWSGIAADVELFYRLGRALSVTGDWPNWHEGDEFRAIRDQSRAQGQ